MLRYVTSFPSYRTVSSPEPIASSSAVSCATLKATTPLLRFVPSHHYPLTAAANHRGVKSIRGAATARSSAQPPARYSLQHVLRASHYSRPRRSLVRCRLHIAP